MRVFSPPYELVIRLYLSIVRSQMNVRSQMQIHPPFRFRNLCAWHGLIAFGVLVAAGCDQTNETDLTTGNQSTQLEPQAPLPDASESQYRFESGTMLYANGEPIAVESPGYALSLIHI